MLSMLIINKFKNVFFKEFFMLYYGILLVPVEFLYYLKKISLYFVFNLVYSFGNTLDFDSFILFFSIFNFSDYFKTFLLLLVIVVLSLYNFINYILFLIFTFIRLKYFLTLLSIIFSMVVAVSSKIFFYQFTIVLILWPLFIFLKIFVGNIYLSFIYYMFNNILLGAICSVYYFTSTLALIKILFFLSFCWLIPVQNFIIINIINFYYIFIVFFWFNSINIYYSLLLLFFTIYNNFVLKFLVFNFYCYFFFFITAHMSLFLLYVKLKLVSFFLYLFSPLKLYFSTKIDEYYTTLKIYYIIIRDSKFDYWRYDFKYDCYAFYDHWIGWSIYKIKEWLIFDWYFYGIYDWVRIPHSFESYSQIMKYVYGYASLFWGTFVYPFFLIYFSYLNYLLSFIYSCFIEFFILINLHNYGFSFLSTVNLFYGVVPIIFFLIYFSYHVISLLYLFKSWVGFLLSHNAVGWLFYFRSLVFSIKYFFTDLYAMGFLKIFSCFTTFLYSSLVVPFIQSFFYLYNFLMDFFYSNGYLVFLFAKFVFILFGFIFTVFLKFSLLLTSVFLYDFGQLTFLYEKNILLLVFLLPNLFYIFFYFIFFIYTFYFTYLLLAFFDNYKNNYINLIFKKTLNMQNELLKSTYLKLNYENITYHGRDDATKSIVVLDQSNDAIEEYWNNWRSGALREFKSLYWRSYTSMWNLRKRKNTASFKTKGLLNLYYYGFFSNHYYFYNYLDYLKHLRFIFKRINYLYHHFYFTNYFKLQVIFSDYNQFFIFKTNFVPLNETYRFRYLRNFFRKIYYREVIWTTGRTLGIISGTKFTRTKRFLNFEFLFFLLNSFMRMIYMFIYYYPVITFKIFSFLIRATMYRFFGYDRGGNSYLKKTALKFFSNIKF